MNVVSWPEQKFMKCDECKRSAKFSIQVKRISLLLCQAHYEQLVELLYPGEPA